MLIGSGLKLELVLETRARTEANRIHKFVIIKVVEGNIKSFFFRLRINVTSARFICRLHIRRIR